MQRTTNYGLCQYEGSDKTSYLVNYNDDMLKIDTAIKNSADAGSSAGTAAERAQSTADGAVADIGTLNTQINGANGLATDVATLQGSVGSINSLIGNGTPTTSDQTIIGAINGIEGAVAPREDGANLANSYAIGKQFARGGSVYTALTALTAGTPFASLVLNTNYKVSDTLVEQIANVPINDLEGDYILSAVNQSVYVTGDGTKTYAELMSELHTALISAFGNLASNQKAVLRVLAFQDIMSMDADEPNYYTNATTGVFEHFRGIAIGTNYCQFREAMFRASNPYLRVGQITDVPAYSVNDYSETAFANNKTISISYDIYDVL